MVLILLPRRRNGGYGRFGKLLNEPLLFGKVKIWGEIVEHQDGYRSEFGKIASLDFGDSALLRKFRRIYRVNQVGTSASHCLKS